MGKKYTYSDIEKNIKEKLDDGIPFYRLDEVNYRGNFKGSNQSYENGIASYLLNLTEEDFKKLLTKGFKVVEEKEFGKPDHDKPVINEDSNRDEEIFVKKLKENENVNYPYDGMTMDDYQIPVVRKDDSKEGKIDCILKFGDILYLTEAKKYKSEETLLRCIVEVLTYFFKVQLNPSSAKRIMEHHGTIDSVFKPAILIFDESYAYKKLVGNDEALMKLLNKYNIKVFVVKTDNGFNLETADKDPIEIVEYQANSFVHAVGNINSSFADMVKDHFSNKYRGTGLTGGRWGNKTYDHILLKLEDNFIDKKVQEYCVIKGKDPDYKKIDYHLGACHLNSSQIMCINFFMKFFEKEENEDILLQLLKNCGINTNEKNIVRAIFEYEPDGKEGTNFDFYMIFDDDTRISFEIKYTEPEFGSIKKDSGNKYDDKWINIYEDMCRNSLYLNEIDKYSFYANYQINRNILYAGKNDYVIFITPRANTSLNNGRDYIDFVNSQYPNVMNIYWEYLIIELEKMIESDKILSDYYRKFREKYFFYRLLKI